MLDRQISVHLLPSLFDAADLRGGIAVILDILRASSTITTALANGALAVVPFEDIDQALRFREQFAGDPRQPEPMSQQRAGSDSAARAAGGNAVLLGGERRGVRIDGFDLSNSPTDYAAGMVQQRMIGFTTTNGTRALLRARQASAVLVGCFLNLAAVIQWIDRQPGTPVHLVCAGTDGQVTGEDVLCAGALVHALQPVDLPLCRNDAASLALSHWMHSVVTPLTQREVTTGTERGNRSSQPATAMSPWPPDPARLFSQIAAAMQLAHGGLNLLQLGFSDDIKICSRMNTIDCVPCFDTQTSQITLLRS